MNQHYVVIHIYIYQIGPFRFRLYYYLEHSTNGELYLIGDNTSIINQEIPVLSPTTANFIRLIVLVYNDTVLFHTPPSLF